MVLLTYCHACQEGDHANHYEVIQAVPEGMLGGSRCRCEGECDGKDPRANFRAVVDQMRDALKGAEFVWDALAAQDETGGSE